VKNHEDTRTDKKMNQPQRHKGGIEREEAWALLGLCPPLKPFYRFISPFWQAPHFCFTSPFSFLRAFVSLWFFFLLFAFLLFPF